MSHARVLVMFTLAGWFVAGGLLAVRDQADDEIAKARQEVLEIDRQHNEAMRGNDAVALDRIIADDCTFTNERGMVFGKAHRVEVTQSGKVLFSSYKVDDVKVQLLGNTAVVTERSTTTGNDEWHSGQFRHTKVFAKREGRWQLIAAHKGFASVDDSADLQKAIATRAQAEQNRDIQTFSRMTADDFTLTNERGEVITKAERIEHLKAGQRQAQSPSDEQIRVYGDTALRTRRVVLDGRHAQMLTVWIKQNGQWKVAATQITPEEDTTQSARESAVYVEQEILRVEELRRQAILYNDIKALDSLMAPEYTAIFQIFGGRLHTKAEELALNESDARKVQSWDATDVQVRVYDDVGLVTGLAEIVDILKGDRRHIRVRYTHVWVKRGSWQLVHRHTTRVATIEGPAPPGAAAAVPSNDDHLCNSPTREDVAKKIHRRREAFDSRYLDAINRQQTEAFRVH